MIKAAFFSLTSAGGETQEIINDWFKRNKIKKSQFVSCEYVHRKENKYDLFYIVYDGEEEK